ncbi:MAG: UDP-N-acetylmuramoylalanyl-D-glutamyl-2,6-diaminopimelate--D-alanyl-D-alanine ligase [Proteobacteria bacterium]|nr:UDP-N-acetylmuramoylalanyl-D-glutamyl-2,6-diaminopimelate--D-alanyl-D-alanine ligase [Pseudomonadota bacterium]
MPTAALWTAHDAAAATGGVATGDWSATGVSIDSRTIEPGDLFVALPGERFDGHDHVAAALARGAAAALISRDVADLPAAAPVLRVADSLEGLRGLARTARLRARARVCAVTGSVGKTGTKEALALVLRRQAPTAANFGNLNNHIGVPLSLARLDAEQAFAVFELGMNHQGEIAPLSALVRPDVAIITTVEAAHLEFFDSEAGIADEKAEIMAGLDRCGAIVLNRDNPHFDRLAAHAARRGIRRVIGFGSHRDAAFRLIGCTADDSGSDVDAVLGGRALRFRIGTPGRHWVINCLAVLAAVDAIGADVGRAARDLADLTPPKGRGTRRAIRFARGTAQLIDDSYNANPSSMGAAFSVLGAAQPTSGGRRIAVLGDMLELGPNAPALHAGLAPALAQQPIDLVFTAGALMRHLHDALPPTRRGAHAASTAELVASLIGALADGDVVLVKGSLGSRMSVIVNALVALESGED